MLNLRAADMLCFSARASLMCSWCWVLRQGQIGSGAVWKVNQSHLRVSPVTYLDSLRLHVDSRGLDSLKLLKKLCFHWS